MARVPKIVPPIRVTIRERTHKTGPSFMNQEFGVEKQRIREETAKIFKDHIGSLSPLICCMPYYEARCAKTINRLVPDSRFIGIERFKDVAENVAEIVPGKKICMVKMTFHRYVNDHNTIGGFDGAFLDFMDPASETLITDITTFIRTKMQPSSIIAITIQGRENDIDSLFDELNGSICNLTKVFTSEYETKTKMCHGIFAKNS